MTQTFPFFQIDAFASKPFEGNQACVMPLSDWSLADDTLQAIAAENNVAETAYIVQTGAAAWDLRWFTPAVEVPLCGHATLAAAHLLFEHEGFAGEQIAFDTRQSGRLLVGRLDDGRLEMNFPAPEIEPIDPPVWMAEALGVPPVRAWRGPYFACELETPDQVRALDPRLELIRDRHVADGHPMGALAAFAAGTGEDGADLVSRFFGPGAGIDEDPATGSWHCMLAAIASGRFGGRALSCVQAYPGRGARIEAELSGDRVKLRGLAVTVIEGRFRL